MSAGNLERREVIQTVFRDLFPWHNQGHGLGLYVSSLDSSYLVMQIRCRKRSRVDAGTLGRH
jgi:hypothetical protein